MGVKNSNQKTLRKYVIFLALILISNNAICQLNGQSKSLSNFNDNINHNIRCIPKQIKKILKKEFGLNKGVDFIFSSKNQEGQKLVCLMESTQIDGAKFFVNQKFIILNEENEISKIYYSQCLATDYSSFIENTKSDECKLQLYYDQNNYNLLGTSVLE